MIAESDKLMTEKTNDKGLKKDNCCKLQTPKKNALLDTRIGHFGGSPELGRKQRKSTLKTLGEPSSQDVDTVANPPQNIMSVTGPGATTDNDTTTTSSYAD